VLVAVEAVAEKRLISEVLTLGRVICESAYDLAWILQHDGKDRPAADREERAQLLLDDSVLTGAKLTKEWVGYGFASEAQAGEAAKAAAEVRKRRGLAPNDMLKLPTIYARAQEAGGQAFTENYSRFFKAMCLDAHASVQGMLRALRGQGDEEFGHNLFMVLMMTISTIEIGCQLIGRTGYLDLIQQIESIIGVPGGSLLKPTVSPSPQWQSEG
jgi:hypothetical protein